MVPAFDFLMQCAPCQLEGIQYTEMTTFRITVEFEKDGEHLWARYIRYDTQRAEVHGPYKVDRSNESLKSSTEHAQEISFTDDRGNVFKLRPVIMGNVTNSQQTQSIRLIPIAGSFPTPNCWRQRGVWSGKIANTTNHKIDNIEELTFEPSDGGVPRVVYTISGHSRQGPYEVTVDETRREIRFSDGQSRWMLRCTTDSTMTGRIEKDLPDGVLWVTAEVKLILSSTTTVVSPA